MIGELCVRMIPRFFVLCCILQCGIVQCIRKAPTGYAQYLGSIDHRRLDHICGCTFIRKHWAITAGGCVLPDPDSVRIAVYHYAAHAGPLYSIEKVILHPGFNETTYANDIALLKFEHNDIYKIFTPISYSSKHVPDGTVLEVVGFARRFYPEVKQKRNHRELRKVKMLSTEKCQQLYPNIDNNQFCSNLNSSDRMRYGDVGGPVVWRTKGQILLVGIVGYSRRDCENYPDRHTKIEPYYKWISDNLR